MAEEATFFSGNVLGHDWGAWAQNEGEETHTRVCKRDASHTETADCTGGTATCTEKAVCEVCGGAHGDLLAHDFSAEVAEEQNLKAEATCTEKADYYKSVAYTHLKQIQGQQDAFRRNIELSERDKYNLDGLIGGVFSRGEITEENKENIFWRGLEKEGL